MGKAARLAEATMLKTDRESLAAYYIKLFNKTGSTQAEQLALWYLFLLESETTEGTT